MNHETVKLSGNIIGQYFHSLRDQMTKLIESGVDSITFDMKDVRLVDSSSISLFFGVHNLLKDRKGTLKIINVSKEIYDLSWSH